MKDGRQQDKELEKLKKENEKLRTQLSETQDALDAIYSGEVDAFVVNGSEGEQIFSLQSADYSYRILIEGMKEGAVSLSEDGSVLYANTYLETLLEMPLERIISSSFEDFVYPEDSGSFQALLHQHRKKGETEKSSMEIRLLSAKGKLIPVQLSINTITIESSPVFGVIITDLSSQKQQEHILVEEQLSRSIIRQSVEAIIVCDEQGRVTRTSQAANDLIGENCINKAFNDVFHLLIERQKPENDHSISTKEIFDDFCIEDVIAGTSYQSVEARIQDSAYPAEAAKEAAEAEETEAAEADKYGESDREDVSAVQQEESEEGSILNIRKGTFLSLSAAPLVDDLGKGIGGIVNITDITDHKRVEQELRQAQKMEAVGRLAGGVAHDYNNMLSVILGYTEMALDQLKKDNPLYADLQEVLSAANRSKEITRQLLAFARKQTISPIELDLNKTVAGMINMLQHLIGEDIELIWNPGSQIPHIKMDPSQIDQIMVNLCINARDAIAGIGRITIETSCVSFDAASQEEYREYYPGTYVMLSVTDNGGGMDRETRQNIFEPFFTTKGHSQGTGLGLSTVYGIIRQNLGFVHVYSEPTAGTSFKLYFPAYGGTVQESGTVDLESIPHGNGEKVLLVEDEEANMYMTKNMLVKLGYSIITANRPRKALKIAAEAAADINLLLTDVVMPEMNGKDLSSEMKSLYPDLKVLFMSGYTADVIAHRGVLDSGVNFIQKPFTMKMLGLKVKEALS